MLNSLSHVLKSEMLEGIRTWAVAFLECSEFPKEHGCNFVNGQRSHIYVKSSNAGASAIDVANTWILGWYQKLPESYRVGYVLSFALMRDDYFLKEPYWKVLHIPSSLLWMRAVRRMFAASVAGHLKTAALFIF